MTGLIYLAGMAGVWVSGRSSDRTGDRKWHCVAGQVGTAVFLALSVIPGQPTLAVLGWLMLTGACAFFWPAPFWALPGQTLTATAAAVAIGVINMCANLAGFIGPTVVGELKKAGVTDSTCLLLLAAGYALGSVLVAVIPVRRVKA
jgi:ACS family tartrate transporter-like MFS transporter